MGSCLEVGAPFGMLGQGWRDGWQPGYRANGFAGVEAPVEDGGAIVGGGESSVGCGVGEQVERVVAVEGTEGEVAPQGGVGGFGGESGPERFDLLTEPGKRVGAEDVFGGVPERVAVPRHRLG